MSVTASGLVKLLFNSVMTACRSAWPNELIKSSAVGAAAGDGDGRVLVTIGEDEFEAGDCAKMAAAKIDIVKLASQNRNITVSFRC